MPATIYLFFALWAGSAAAKPVTEKPNVREACRQEIAGGYLVVYDALNRAGQYARMLTENRAELKKAIVDAEKDVRAKKDAQQKAGFDLDKAVAVDHAETKLKMLREREAELAQQLEGAERQKVASAAEEKRLRASIEKVFVFSRVEDKADGGYPMRLEWRAKCPKYRFLCPLPRIDSDQLLELRVDGKLPEPCLRYAGLSKLR